MLWSNYDFEILKNNLKPNTFEYSYYRAKLNRKEGDLVTAVQDINLALGYFDVDDISIKHADALDEYGVIQRASQHSADKIIPHHQRSVAMRKKLSDNEGLGLTYLYLGNVYTTRDINIDSSAYYYQLAIDHLTHDDPYLSHVIKHNLANAYINEEIYQEAKVLFEESRHYFEQHQLYEYAASSALGLADVYLSQNNYPQAQFVLDEIKSDSIFQYDLNYRGYLFKSYSDLYRANQQYELAFEMNDSLDANYHIKSEKIELDAAEKYESQRYKNQLIQEDLISTRRMWIATTLGSLLLLSFIGFYLYSRNRRQEAQLREQHLLLQKQQALEDERNRIAAEMHDDLGGGLTTIKFVSQRARRKMEHPRDQALLDKIINQSNTLVTNMSEIIWAMNSKFDNLLSTVAYLRRYSKEYLDDFDITLDFDHHDHGDHLSLTSTARRNILLIVKEALNNIVKHADAQAVSIRITHDDNHLSLIIIDNGKGLTNHNTIGNGIENIQDRIKQLGGTVSFLDAAPGLMINCKIPLTDNGST